MTQDIRDPLIGRLIDHRYTVSKRVARGGMATVYAATDERLERTIALKVMHPHLADDEDFRDRFIQEAKAAARLTHPNLVSVFDQGTQGDVAYLAMEYVPSMTLRDYLLKHGALTPKQSLQVTEAVLAGLAAAHKADLVHRDIKPENILLANDGRIKIGDFGLARAASANTATGKALLGTIAYLSPELVTRGQADKRSDIYAVGIMLFEMLTGKQPFTGEQPMQIAYQHANEQVPAPSTIEPGIPRSLDLIVEWATQRDPELRPSDAGEFLKHVQDVRSGGITEQQQTLLLATDTQATTRAVERASTAEAPAVIGTTEEPGPVSGAPGTLVRKTTARRRRGLVWLAATLVIAVTLGITGWWLSIGPGARIDLPETTGATYEQAVEMLADAGLESTPLREDEPNYDVPAGEVLEMRPGAGSSIPKDEVVTLVVSAGRQDLPAPNIVGMQEDQAQTAIEDAGFVFDDDLVDRRFNRDVERGSVVVGMLEEGETFEPETEIEERTAMGYILSLGGIPAQAGQSQEEATSALHDVNLEVSIDTEHSRDVDEGDVIEVQVPDNPVREGDTVTLVISLGPPLIEIPDVSDMTFQEAITELEDLGFDVVPETDIQVRRLWGAFGVESTDPEIGTEVPEGSTITVVGEH
ncbi:Stk1 family PASTA domain-containing Ser/Thr kinase [uncultured Agrococcus sp.]|uniref:Stk1 family PASTA domain-containing Ser/Thr kinase n=1 Tax=uncultured Agrococcus sp. TaxID=382258 RepID=UPI0025EC45C3|nr:Stk1 family PASTA domain-containing Ser/Thr kinase [uncultured Agrococcus sp.]